MENLDILLGWSLGLFSSALTLFATINIDKKKATKNTIQLFDAICTESKEIQIRMALTTFGISKKYGGITKEYLLWLRSIVGRYEGNEPLADSLAQIDRLRETSDDDFQEALENLKRTEIAKGDAIHMKTQSASFLDSNLSLISELPQDIQSKIHEYRNQLNIFNSEASSANEYLRMTFDPNITGDLLKQVVHDIGAQY